LQTVIVDPNRSLPRVLYQSKLRPGASTAPPASNGTRPSF
jgi:hypothetical protein